MRSGPVPILKPRRVGNSSTAEFPQWMGTQASGAPAVALRTAWLLLAIVLAGLALRVAFAPELAGSDDISLANSAPDVLDKGIRVPPWPWHYYARFGLTIPLAAVFRVAGVGVPQLDVVPMLVSAAGMVLAWRLGRLLFDDAVGLAAAAALALFPMDIEFATILCVDTAQDALLAAAALCALLARQRGAAWAVLSGAFWAWAYYVKVDAAFLALVLLLATAMGYVRVQHLIIAGLVALALVGVELVTYGVLTGHPFLHLELEHAAANEALAPGHDYRNWFTYPRAMFVVPYETGLHFYVLVATLLLAAVTRSRPALLLAGWVAIWMAWLTFGLDPLGGALRLKPQLPRYLMSFSAPMSILVGWFGMSLWRRSRLLGAGLAVAGVALAALLTPLNQLNFEGGFATRAALAKAVRERWLPLYPDEQSVGMVDFLVHGTALASQVHLAQHHDYLAGVTRFDPIPDHRAYLLINQDFARREAQISMVQPMDPARFGMQATKVAQVDNPLPAIDYAVMRLLARAADVLPAPLRDHIRRTTVEVLRPDDAEVYRLDPR